jgi:SAM-dependent methyltransferase
MPSNAKDSAADANIPVGVDSSRASVARVYDFLLGGKDNYKIDRQTAKQLAATLPDVVGLARDNRNFLTRVARFVATQTDIAQYLDCGSGLPTAENTHQIVQRFNPESTVVYVDNDPVVLAHGRALLEENDRTFLVDGDIFNPPSILSSEVVQTRLDFDQPIALFFIATLHHHKGARNQPAEIMREYIDALPSGSVVAISHLIDPEDEDSETMRQLEETVAKGSLGGATSRTRAEIQELFDGLVMIPPGIVHLKDWWPDGPQLKSVTVAQRLIAGGVGRKP